jgi:hypothetical protein
MVVIAYYYYAESASAELITPTRGSVWFLLGVIATVSPPKKATCYASVRRGGTKDPSLNASDISIL